MRKKKVVVDPMGQWNNPGDITIIPSNSITMQGVNYPVLGIDNLGNQQMMMPGGSYTFPGDYVTEIPQMGKGGLTQWFAEEWTDIKTGKPCGRQEGEKRAYPACRPKKRVNETTPKTSSEMSSAEKAKFKRSKTSGERISYNHKRKEYGGENWLDTYQEDGERSTAENPDRIAPVYITTKRSNPFMKTYRKVKSFIGSNPYTEKDSTLENVVEFFDPTGISSWDDARRAYNQWQSSGNSLPSFEQSMDIFGAMPMLGKFAKLKYLAKGDEYLKQAYKYFNWQEALNRADAIQDELFDNPPQSIKPAYYQSGGKVALRTGNTFDDEIFNPFMSMVAGALDTAGEWTNDFLGSTAESLKNNLVSSPFAPMVWSTEAKAKPWLFENVRPVQYPGIVSSTIALGMGAAGATRPPVRDPQGDYDIGEEAWRRALGLETKPKYIVPSKYKPSKSTNPDAQYYTLGENIIDPALIIAEAKKRNLQQGQSAVIDSLAPYIREGYMPREEFSQIDPLQKFTIGMGQDAKGKYVSIYDKYDFQGPLNSFINPYEFYDRYYYKQGGSTGWLNKYN